MIIGDFLTELSETGRPVFRSADAPRDLGKPAELTAQKLAEYDAMRRLHAPGIAPDFDPEMAHAAAGALCRLAQFTVFRELPADVITQEWSYAKRDLILINPTHSHIWSADVVLSFLPAIFRMANAVAEGDPLLVPIRELAKTWPLSGIGITDAGWTEEDFAPVLAHECLAGILIDRVFATKERTVAAFPTIHSRMKHAVGDFPKQLAPWLADISTL